MLQEQLLVAVAVVMVVPLALLSLVVALVVVALVKLLVVVALVLQMVAQDKQFRFPLQLVALAALVLLQLIHCWFRVMQVPPVAVMVKHLQVVVKEVDGAEIQLQRPELLSRQLVPAHV